MADEVKKKRRIGEPEKRSTAHGRDRVSVSPLPPVLDSLLQADLGLLISDLWLIGQGEQIYGAQRMRVWAGTSVQFITGLGASRLLTKVDLPMALRVCTKSQQRISPRLASVNLLNVEP